MSIAYAVDGETDLDSSFFNPIIDRVNGDAGPLANLRLGTYNVLDYADGAIAGGATDFTPYVQGAIDAAEVAGGGTVYFPAGDYLMNPISGFGPSSMKVCCYIDSDNITILLDPNATIINRTGHVNGTVIFNFNGMIRPAGVAAWADHWISLAANTAQYPICAIDPVAKGDGVLTLDVAGDAANFAVGDAVLIRTGQTIDGGPGNSEPDSELNEIAAIDGGVLSLRWPTGKPFAQEYFVSGTNGVTSTSVTANPALFGVQNVEAAVLRNCRVAGGKWDLRPDAGVCWGVFFVQVIGWSMDDIDADMVNGSLQNGGTFRTFRCQNVHVVQENTISAEIFISTNTGCSDGRFKSCDFVGTSDTYPGILHVNEGTADVKFENVNVRNAPSATNNHGLQLRGRWYDIEFNGLIEHQSSGNGTPIDMSDDGDGFLLDARLVGSPSPLTGSNVTVKQVQGYTLPGPGVQTPGFLVSQWVYYNSPSSFIIARLPGHAFIVHAGVYIWTTFNGTSPSIRVGKDGGYDRVLIDQTSLSGSQGPVSITREPTTAYYLESATPVDVEVTYNAGGSSAGKALITLFWAMPEIGIGI